MLRFLYGPVRAANAEGSRKGGMSRVRPTAVSACSPELVPETTRREEPPSASLQPLAELRSLVLDLGSLGFQGQMLQEKRKHHGW